RRGARARNSRVRALPGIDRKRISRSCRPASPHATSSANCRESRSRGAPRSRGREEFSDFRIRKLAGRGRRSVRTAPDGGARRGRNVPPKGKMNADLKPLERQLHDEGFLHTYVWQDGPNVFYADHTHASETAHIILDGEMTRSEE